jgi:hypothetical protein
MRVKNPLGQFNSRKSVPSRNQPDQPDPGLKGLPDLVEPVVGWRAWKVRTLLLGSNSRPTLSSIILDTTWAPRRKITAEHNFDLGEKCSGLLEPECSCGVYAFKNRADAFTYLVRVRDRLVGMSVDVAIGTVSLWGRVVECEKGFKGQFAYPHHIYVPASVSRFVPTVSSAFGVAVGVYASTCEKDISIAIPTGGDGQNSQTLYLKNADFPGFENFPFEVGFFDLAPSLARQSQRFPGHSDVPFLSSGAERPLEDGDRP